MHHLIAIHKHQFLACRHSLGSRRGSSEMVSDGSSFDSSDDEEGGESHAAAVRQQPLVQQAPARTCQ